MERAAACSINKICSVIKNLPMLHLLVSVTLSIILLISNVRGAPLSLLAIGDWGGDSDSQPTTKAQVDAANGMSRVFQEKSVEAVLLLGDNFYTHGVSSSSSSRFQETFEEVYTKEMFGELPFHVIAGNHDHYGDVNAQLEYHGSDRWNFPSLYYTLPFNYISSSGVNRSVDIVMVDTVTLVGSCVGGGDYAGCPIELKDDHRQLSDDQWTWLRKTLSESTADFVWVAGHYPIYSAGSDGTTDTLVKNLLPLLKQYNAHYISGHDHMHEHIFYDDVHMFVTGPGRFCCYEPTHWDTVPEGAMKFMVSGTNAQGKGVGPKVEEMESGFSTMEFDDECQITMYKEDGSAVYTPEAIMPRTMN